MQQLLSIYTSVMHVHSRLRSCFQNIFQAVLVTDSDLSFVIFNYGGIAWTEASQQGDHAQVECFIQSIGSFLSSILKPAFIIPVAEGLRSHQLK